MEESLRRGPTHDTRRRKEKGSPLHEGEGLVPLCRLCPLALAIDRRMCTLEKVFIIICLLLNSISYLIYSKVTLLIYFSMKIWKSESRLLIFDFSWYQSRDLFHLLSFILTISITLVLALFFYFQFWRSFSSISCSLSFTTGIDIKSKFFTGASFWIVKRMEEKDFDEED